MLYSQPSSRSQLIAIVVRGHAFGFLFVVGIFVTYSVKLFSTVNMPEVTSSLPGYIMDMGPNTSDGFILTVMIASTRYSKYNFYLGLDATT